MHAQTPGANAETSCCLCALGHFHLDDEPFICLVQVLLFLPVETLFSPVPPFRPSLCYTHSIMAMEDRSSEILAVCLFFFVISWLAVGLRVWVRAGMLKSFGLDDWSMMATQLIYTAYLSCQLGGLMYGTGRHLKDLEDWRAEKAFSVCGSDKSSYASTNTLNSSGTSARFSTSPAAVS